MKNIRPLLRSGDWGCRLAALSACGGHTRPGGTQYLPVALIGPVWEELSANEAIWSFFARHPRP